jgi:tRNA (guanine37-N1)-methyltransferase
VWFGVVSLFPEMFQSLQAGITGRAIKEKLLQLDIWNPRDFALDKHKSVDDKPYGGGPGMVMMAEPLQAAIQAAKKAAPRENTKVIYLSPQGQSFTQKTAEDWAEDKSIILVAGRYEGIDERVIEQEIDEEWSIGDYILTGGELPAMVMIDAISRLIPGIVGDENSVKQDSITTGVLKYPQYTRPESFAGKAVPDVLLSGHHRQIEKWRIKQSLGKTWLKRPDLLAKKALNKEQSSLLAEFIEDFLKSSA